MTCLICGSAEHDHTAHRDAKHVERHAQKHRRLGDLDAYRRLHTHAVHLFATELLEQLRAGKGAA